MIKLEVQDYCQNCGCFQADVEHPQTLYFGGEPFDVSGDTIVRCEYRNHCKRLKRHLEKQKGE